MATNSFANLDGMMQTCIRNECKGQCIRYHHHMMPHEWSLCLYPNKNNLWTEFMLNMHFHGFPLSLAKTPMQDSLPQLLEHRRKELQERQATYRSTTSQHTEGLCRLCESYSYDALFFLPLSGGSHGLRGFPDVSTPKQKQIYPRMNVSTTRKGVTLNIHCTTRRWFTRISVLFITRSD